MGGSAGRRSCASIAAFVAVLIASAALATPAGASNCGEQELDTAYVGQTITLTATVCEGAPAGTVQWEVFTDGGQSFTPIAGATANTLTLSGPIDNEIFEPVYSGLDPANGWFWFQVNILPVPTLSNETVAAGSTATFALQSNWVPAAVQWQESTDGGATWPDDTTDSGATTDTLTIANVDSSQSGEELRAQITDDSGTVTTAPATLTVGSPPSAPPTITTNPTPYTRLCPGSPVTLTAAATGPPTPTSVQWQYSTDASSVGDRWFNDTTDTGTTTDTLQVQTPSQIGGNIAYRAVFTNSVGSTATAAAEVNSAGLFDDNPTGSTVFPGQPATVSVALSSCYSGVSVQWDTFPADTAIPGATSPTYTTPPVSATPEFTEYQPVLTYGSEVENLDPATVVVESVPAPTSQFVTPGETATFSAAANPTDGAWQWQVSTDGGTTWTNDTIDAGATTSTLTVSDTTLAENGNEYRAAITDSAGTVDTPPATLTVETVPPPVITEEPTDVQVCFGEPAVFTAQASGDPTPTVQWQVSTDAGNTWTNDTTDPGNTTDTLSVTNPGPGDEYRAVFTNIHGPATTTAVEAEGDFLPPPFLPQGNPVLLVGQTATFTLPSFPGTACYSTLPVQWQVSTTGAYANIPGATSGTLTIANITAADSGSYRVVVEAGSDPSFSGSLTVRTLCPRPRARR